MEYDLYKSDKKEDRFEEVFRKIAEMELQRSVDLESIKLNWVKHKHDLEDILFSQDQKLLKVDNFERTLIEQTGRFETIENRFQRHVEQTGNLINKTQKEFGDRLTAIHNNVRKNNSEIDDHENRI
jgi:hypothetical protein